MACSTVNNHESEILYIADKTTSGHHCQVQETTVYEKTPNGGQQSSLGDSPHLQIFSINFLQQRLKTRCTPQ